MIRTHHIAPGYTPQDIERSYQALLVIGPEDLANGSLENILQSVPFGIALQISVPITAATRYFLKQLIEGDRPFLLLTETQQDPTQEDGSQEYRARKDRTQQDPTQHDPTQHDPTQQDPTQEDPILENPSRKDPLRELFEPIALSLFSRNYIRIDEAPVLVFTDGKDPTASELIIRLKQQGWPDILQWTTRNSHWLTSLQQAPDMAGDLLRNNKEYVFIKGKDLEDTLALEQGLYLQTENLLDEAPLFRKHRKEKQQLEKKLEILRKEKKLLQERLQNAETTIGIIRNKYKGDYDILFNWYQQEYEVLPVWYKRFGQLIKVLIGKRTAKSLYHAALRRVQRRTNTKKGKT